MTWKNRITGIAVLLLISLVGLQSCKKMDTLPMLEIKVFDKNDDIVQGILVGLFDSKEEWSMRENPVQPWRETSIYGEALFTHLKEQIYYIYVDGDSISNIGHEIQIQEPLRLNERRQLYITVE